MLLQEYGSPVLIEGDAQQLLRTIENTNIHWQNQLGLRKKPLEVVLAEDGGIQVRARGVTGQIRLGKYELHIAPKYLPPDEVERWQESLFDVLSFANESKFRHTTSIKGDIETDGFIELLARSYAEAVEVALERGAPRSYKQSKELLDMARGQLITEKLYPQVLRDPSKLWFETDEFSKDIMLTRLLHWACDQFANLVDNAAIRNELLDVKQRFVDVPAKKPSKATLDRFFISPKHRHFEDAFNMARWLADNQGPTLAAQQMEIPGVLLKSRSIYQGFVGSCFQHVANSMGWMYEDEPTRSFAFGAKTLSTKPDHYITNDNCTLLLDSKYKGKTEWNEKETNGSTPLRNQDVYQIMAGSRVFDAPKAVLVYPSVPEEFEQVWHIEGDGLPRTLHTLEINPAQFTQKNEFLNRIESKLQAILDYDDGDND